MTPFTAAVLDRARGTTETEMPLKGFYATFQGQTVWVSVAYSKQPLLSDEEAQNLPEIGDLRWPEAAYGLLRKLTTKPKQLVATPTRMVLRNEVELTPMEHDLVMRVVADGI